MKESESKLNEYKEAIHEFKNAVLEHQRKRKSLVFSYADLKFFPESSLGEDLHSKHSTKKPKF